MRKTILAALLGTAILAGCAKETMLEETVKEARSSQPIEVDITVASPGDEVDTKAAKTNWKIRDRINIWYDSNWNQTAPDLVLMYDGTTWGVLTTAKVSGNKPSTSGTLYALYLSDNTSLSTYTVSVRNAVTAFWPNSYSMPMAVKTGACSYTCSNNTLKSTLSGWSFLTKFKVLVKDPDGEMTSSASSYKLMVANATKSTKASNIRWFERNSSGFGSTTAYSTTCGIKESDGIAFYFSDFSVASSDQVAFYLSEENWAERTVTKTGKALTTSSSACTGISLNYSSFSVVTTNLSSSATANSYIVSKSGAYKFKTVKGNSSTSVGTVSSATVLWESFGTSTAPSEGELIKDVSYSNGYITFSASNKKGNAVIAAKNSSGTILWSWHIWMTDQPEDQVYSNNAGTMMDRYLGATSATKGDLGALGLFYQWGRKDPFLGFPTITSSARAASTINWPSAESSSEHLSSNNTLAYATANPTVFLVNDSAPNDWYCINDQYNNHNLWTSSKTIYDPCPVGYRVPDGGESGIWSKAFGTSSEWRTEGNWDKTNRGMDFGSNGNTDKKLSTTSTSVWYPVTGRISGISGQFDYQGSTTLCWSSTNNPWALALLLDSQSTIEPGIQTVSTSHGLSVRCCKE